MEFSCEEEWGKKITTELNLENSEKINETENENENENNFTTLTIPNIPINKNVRRHSSILLKHGLEILEENKIENNDEKRYFFL